MNRPPTAMVPPSAAEPPYAAPGVLPPSPPPSELSGRRVAVIGLQRSNAAVVRFLTRHGARAEVYDRLPADQLSHAVSLPPSAALQTGEQYLQRFAATLPGLAAVFVTPGMRKDLPELQAAADLGIPLCTEAGYVVEHAPVPVIGITGSAGKTTVTTLVGEAVTRSRPGSLVGGNIGLPLIDHMHEAPHGSLLVLELSSFQLELCRASPAIAAVLNLRANHLDLHGTFEAYAAAKRRVFAFQRSSDVCVFGRDDDGARAMAAGAPGAVLWFSGEAPVPRGAGCAGGAVWWYPPTGPAVPECVVACADVRVPGRHNLGNVAAAVAMCRAAGVPAAAVAAAVRDFRGVPHRLEPVARRGGALYVNDSIATAPDRVLAALRSLDGQRIVLLAGGYDKGLPMEELAEAIVERVDRVVLFGAAAPRLEDAIAQAAERLARPSPAVQRTRGLDEAVSAAACAAAEQDGAAVVLLSPACASFDEFRDFEARGQRFRERVLALPD